MVRKKTANLRASRATKKRAPGLKTTTAVGRPATSAISDDDAWRLLQAGVEVAHAVKAVPAARARFFRGLAKLVAEFREAQRHELENIAQAKLSEALSGVIGEARKHSLSAEQFAELAQANARVLGVSLSREQVKTLADFAASSTAKGKRGGRMIGMNAVRSDAEAGRALVGLLMRGSSGRLYEKKRKQLPLEVAPVPFLDSAFYATIARRLLAFPENLARITGELAAARIEAFISGAPAEAQPSPTAQEIERARVNIGDKAFLDAAAELEVASKMANASL
jgi:hypothetical protein